MREENMPPNEKKEPIEDLKDKLRSFFDPRNPQKKKDALPRRRYFVHHFLLKNSQRMSPGDR
jgi:hypothetical protein